MSFDRMNATQREIIGGECDAVLLELQNTAKNIAKQQLDLTKATKEIADQCKRYASHKDLMHNDYDQYRTLDGKYNTSILLYFSLQTKLTEWQRLYKKYCDIKKSTLNNRVSVENWFQQAESESEISQAIIMEQFNQSTSILSRQPVNNDRPYNVTEATISLFKAYLLKLETALSLNDIDKADVYLNLITAITDSAKVKNGTPLETEMNTLSASVVTAKGRLDLMKMQRQEEQEHAVKVAALTNLSTKLLQHVSALNSPLKPILRNVAGLYSSQTEWAGIGGKSKPDKLSKEYYSLLIKYHQGLINVYAIFRDDKLAHQNKTILEMKTSIESFEKQLSTYFDKKPIPAEILDNLKSAIAIYKVLFEDAAAVTTNIKDNIDLSQNKIDEVKHARKEREEAYKSFVILRSNYLEASKKHTFKGKLSHLVDKLFHSTSKSAKKRDFLKTTLENDYLEYVNTGVVSEQFAAHINEGKEKYTSAKRAKHSHKQRILISLFDRATAITSPTAQLSASPEKKRK